MFTQLAKILLGVTGFAAVVGLVYPFVAGGDQIGTALLFGVASAALVGGVAAATVLSDPPPPADEPAAESTVAAPSPPSPWPLVAGLGVVVLATGLAAGAPVALSGLALALVGAAGWFARSWGEHPVWTARYGERTSERLLTPLFLPVGVLLLVGFMVVSFSRVLLALPSATASSVAALVVAVVIMAGCTLVAVRPTMGTSAVGWMVVLAAVLTVAGGVSGAVAGEREFHHKGGDHGAHADDDGHAGEAEDGGHAGEAAGEETSTLVEMTADALEFGEDEIHLAAGQEVGIRFRNEEAAPHNVALYDGTTTLFRGEIITGPDEVEYHLGPLEAGTYEFRCDVHPTMKGKAVVG